MNGGTFRKDIEALRGVAVLMVLFFHFKIPGFAGGYAGVDIFLVISGFLITGIFLNNIEYGNNSLFDFYKRRFRRIAPAYYVVILATAILSSYFLFLEDFLKFRDSFIYAALFASNFLFSNESGYFDTSADFKPLLHTWSLAVEMQFYLSWPFILLFIRKFNEKIHIKAVLLVMSASFLASVLLTLNDPALAFYSVLTRYWEFMLGAYVSLAIRYRRIEAVGHSTADIALFVCSVCTLVAFPFFADGATPWPAPLAAIVCIPVAYIIYKGTPAGFIGCILINPLFSNIGRISYSVYLIHWPIFVFSSYYYYPNYSLLDSFSFLILSIFSGYFLYILVEQRFLSERFKGSKSTGALVAFPVSVSIVVALAFIVWPRNIDSMNLYDTGDVATISSIGDRLVSKKDVRNVVLWGDSHAVALNSKFRREFDKMNVNFASFMRDGCPPLLGVTVRSGNFSSEKSKCNDVRENFIRYIRDLGKVDSIVIAARWPFYYNSDRLSGEAGSSIKLFLEGQHFNFSENNHKEFYLSLLKTIEELKNHADKIVIIGSVPEFHFDPARCVAMSKRKSFSIEACHISYEFFEDRNKAVDMIINGITDRDESVFFIRVSDVVCNDDHCDPMIEGFMGYMDNNHIRGRLVGHVFDIFENIISINN